jgi:hypothetical protein
VTCFLDSPLSFTPSPPQKILYQSNDVIIEVKPENISITFVVIIRSLRLHFTGSSTINSLIAEEASDLAYKKLNTSNFTYSHNPLRLSERDAINFGVVEEIDSLFLQLSMCRVMIHSKNVHLHLWRREDNL